MWIKAHLLLFHLSNLNLAYLKWIWIDLHAALKHILPQQPQLSMDDFLFISQYSFGFFADILRQ